MLALNEIHHGDCLDLMRHIPDGSVDMILCDLPYGTTACKWDTIIPFAELWAHYERVIKPNGAIVLTASQPFTSALVMSNPKLFRYEWIWQKEQGVNFQLAKKQPLKNHESVLVFSAKSHEYNPQGLRKVSIQKSNAGKYGKVLSNHGQEKTAAYVQEFSNYPKSIQAFSRTTGLHPTQKPVALFEYLIRTYTNPGEVVLDNCAGSFTTAVAAENTGRRWLCIEQEAKYCDIARARLAARHAPLPLFA